MPVLLNKIFRAQIPPRLLAAFAAALVPVLLGAELSTALTALVTVMSLTSIEGEPMHLLPCAHCAQTTPHTELSVFPAFDCTGQLLALFTIYQCQRCGHQHYIRNAP